MVLSLTFPPNSGLCLIEVSSLPLIPFPDPHQPQWRHPKGRVGKDKHAEPIGLPMNNPTEEVFSIRFGFHPMAKSLRSNHQNHGIAFDKDLLENEKAQA